MSTFKVEICKINEVLPHGNADRLEIIKLDGKDWTVVSGKGLHQPGELCLYFPIDSLLPAEVESKIFPPESKVKLNNSRVRTIKLRGAISQGLIVKPELFDLQNKKLGFDATSLLNVTKYEPEQKGATLSNGGKIATKKQTNPHFRKYTGIENAKNYNNIFEEGEEVVVTEKIHGANFRCGYVELHVNTLWKKIKNIFKLNPKYEFVYGSHNVQLQDKLLYTGYYDTNVYAEAVVKYNLKQILKPNETVFGEIIGDGIQKGYTYGCKNGERKLVFFEVKVNDKWLSPIEAKKWFDERQLPFVPILYKGPFNKEKILSLRDGDSVYCPEQKVREGVVVRSIEEKECYIGRKILKFISDNYLLKNQDSESIAH